MKNSNSHVTHVTRRTATLTRRDQDKHSERSGMVESKKTYVGPSLHKLLVTVLS